MNPSEVNSVAAAANPPQSEAPPVKTKAVVGQNEQVLSLLDLVIDEHDRKALVKQELNRLTYNNNWRLAEVFAAAGYFDSNGMNSPPMSKEQAMAKIEIGESWDLNPANSIRFVYIIGGKPAIEEAVFASRLYDAGWSWEAQFIGGQGQGCKGVRLFAIKDGKPVMQTVRDEATGEPKLGPDGNPMMRQAFAEFTEEQAAGIKIWQKGNQVSLLQKSGPWSDGRRSNMYFWRAVSQFRRWFAPNVIAGALTRDEAQDIGPIENLEVSNTETPLPSERATVFAEIEKATKAKPDPKPAPAETKQPDPEPKVVEPEPKKAEPEAKQPAPITKQTFSALSKIEAHMTTEKFNEFLQQHTFKNLSEIKFEADGMAMLMRLRELPAK
jgi:hypothetical protein